MSLYEFFIGFRYLKSKKGRGTVSSNTLLSIIIVFLGVFILIVVLSVMNGFQAAIKDKILDVDAHISVQSMYGPSEGLGIRNYETLVKKIRQSEDVRAADPSIMSQALFRFGSNIAPVMIRGVGTNGRIPGDVAKFIVKDKDSFLKKGTRAPSKRIEGEFFNTRSVFI